MESYRIIDLETYYRRDVFRHFAEHSKCSVSMTKRVDVTALYDFSKRTGTKFYLNFLYVLTKALNSRDDYRMYWAYQTNELRCYDRINPVQYVFHEDSETFSVVYTEYDPDWRTFYDRAAADLERGKTLTGCDPHNPAYPNWFDASCVPWIDYDAVNVELPDGWLYLAPIVNWGKFTEENGVKRMPLTIRLNHAIADGYLLAKAFLTVEAEIENLCRTDSRRI